MSALCENLLLCVCVFICRYSNLQQMGLIPAPRILQSIDYHYSQSWTELSQVPLDRIMTALAVTTQITWSQDRVDVLKCNRGWSLCIQMGKLQCFDCYVGRKRRNSHERMVNILVTRQQGCSSGCIQRGFLQSQPVIPHKHG